MFFVDNDSARDGMIRGSSDSDMSRDIIAAFAATDMIRPCFPWFARVASAANPSDEPSRLVYTLMRQLGAVQVFPQEATVVDSVIRF